MSFTGKEAITFGHSKRYNAAEVAGIPGVSHIKFKYLIMQWKDTHSTWNQLANWCLKKTRTVQGRRK